MCVSLNTILKGRTDVGGGDHSDRPIKNSASCSISINGDTKSNTVSASGSRSYSSSVCGRSEYIPAGVTTNIIITLSGGYRIRGSVCMVFI